MADKTTAGTLAGDKLELSKNLELAANGDFLEATPLGAKPILSVGVEVEPDGSTVNLKSPQKTPWSGMLVVQPVDTAVQIINNGDFYLSLAQTTPSDVVVRSFKIKRDINTLPTNSVAILVWECDALGNKLYEVPQIEHTWTAAEWAAQEEPLATVEENFQIRQGANYLNEWVVYGGQIALKGQPKVGLPSGLAFEPWYAIDSQGHTNVLSNVEVLENVGRLRPISLALSGEEIRLDPGDLVGSLCEVNTGLINHFNVFASSNSIPLGQTGRIWQAIAREVHPFDINNPSYEIIQQAYYDLPGQLENVFVGAGFSSDVLIDRQQENSNRYYHIILNDRANSQDIKIGSSKNNLANSTLLAFKKTLSQNGGIPSPLTGVSTSTKISWFDGRKI